MASYDREREQMKEEVNVNYYATMRAANTEQLSLNRRVYLPDENHLRF